MKKLIVVVLGVAILAGVGFAAYRFGLFPRVTEEAAPGESPAAPATEGAQPSSSTSAVGESGAAGAPAAAEANAATPGAGTLAAGGASTEGTAPAPPILQPAIAQPGQAVANTAVEVRVTNVRTATAIGAQTADQGREFVIVESAWKNVMPLVPVNRKKAQDRTVGMGALGFGGGATAADKAKDEANTTLEPMKFAIGPMPSHVWLIVDGRFAEEIDVRATNATDGHLPAGTLMIPALNDVRSGGLVYQAPVNAQALSLLVLDSNNGHLLLPLKGAPPALASSLGGKSRANEVVDLVVIGTAWAEPPADAPGMKTLVVSVKGISRQNAIADVPFGEFGFLQTDQGCVAQPEEQSSAVTRPLAPIGRFLPMVPNEGQLAFTVPSGTRSAILMLRARSAAAIDLPALGDGTVSKPTASATHQDGSVLRVSVVGTGVPPADLPAPPAGSEYLVVDYIVENLTTGTGIELQPQQQFALVDSAGKQYRPASASRQLPCRLTGEGVVPAGGWRRFSLLYAVPARQPLNVQYRGFESAGTLKVR